MPLDVGSRIDILKVLILAHNEIVSLAYDPHLNRLARTASRRIDGVGKIVSLRGTLVAAGQDRLVLMSMDLVPIRVLEFGSISGVYADDHNLYVGADGAFVCLDDCLNEVSRSGLACSGMLCANGKNIDGILVHAGIAYLLDDIISPLFALALDISDRHKPRLVGEYSWEGVNAHLSLQFINPDLNQWVVKEDYGHQGGSGEVLHIFDLFRNDSGTRPVIRREMGRRGVHRTIFSWSVLEDRGPVGHRIKDVLPFPVHWGVIEDGGCNAYLGKVSTTGCKVRFSCLAPLTLSPSDPRSTWARGPDFIVRRTGDLVFTSAKEMLLYSGCDRKPSADRVPFFVLDVSGKRPMKLLETDLAQCGIEGVSDLVVI